MRKPSTALAVLLVSSGAIAQCITGTGTPITVTQDSISGPNAIGFAFPFCGATYTDIHISDHGLTFLSNGGVPAPPAAGPLVWTPQASSLVVNTPMICPSWSDSIPGTSPTSTFYIDAQPTQCTVSWLNIQSYGFATPKFTFQLKLYISGEIEFLYGPTVTNNSNFGGVSDNGVVGVSPGSPAVLPAAVDFLTNPVTLDNTVFHQFTLPNTFDMQNDSLRLIPTNPGWVAIFTVDGAGCTYGAGCGGLTLTHSAAPVVNTTINLVTSGITPTAPFGALAMGFVKHDPGLVILGAPVGCLQYNELLVTNLFLPLGASTVTVPFTVPNFPGMAIQVMSISYDPTAILAPIPVNTTGGIELRLGN
ncbi:MAG: hypothetical protein Q7V88_16330 [Actinomycetota bacterium]|nr:hypothetical protein [Actinomycetota bacterium]